MRLSDFLDKLFPGRVWKREIRREYYEEVCPVTESEHEPEEWFAAYPVLGTFSGFACVNCGREVP